MHVKRHFFEKDLLNGKPLEKMIPVDEYISVKFDQPFRRRWKKNFGDRNLTALSMTEFPVRRNWLWQKDAKGGYQSDTKEYGKQAHI